MTKYIVCLGDGMADEPIVKLGNKTPLQFANTPHMDWIASQGISGMVHTVPQGFSPGSDVANMGILGYKPQDYYTGRAPIEAAALGIQLNDTEIAFRCNLVSIENGIMKSFTSDHITTEEASEIIQELNAGMAEEDIRFFSGVSYRHIAVMPNTYTHVTSTPPHDITDKLIKDYLPKGQGENVLQRLFEKSEALLKKSSINQKRIEKGLLPATHIWLWSQGSIPVFPSYQEKYALSGGIVTAVDLLKGLGKLANLETPDIPGATGFVDTNYENKMAAAFDILSRHDFVYIHIEAPDESGHLGDVDLKVKAIEDFDQKVVGPVVDYYKKEEDVRILVLPDHPTPCKYKTHTHAPVPFAMTFSGIPKDKVQTYDEIANSESPYEVQTPWDLMNYFLGKTTSL